MTRAKKLGFSDKQIGLCVSAKELEVRDVTKNNLVSHHLLKRLIP